MAKNNKKRPKERQTSHGTERVTLGAVKAFNWKLLLIVVLNTIIFFAIYRLALSLQFYFEVVLGLYLALTAAFAFAYVFYNRGFSRRGVTAEMLPDTMSAAQKCEFIADGERRLKKSKWMLTILFPLLVTLTFEVFELYVVDYFVNLFG